MKTRKFDKAVLESWGQWFGIAKGEGECGQRAEVKRTARDNNGTYYRKGQSYGDENK